MSGVKDPDRYTRKQPGRYSTWPIWDGPPVTCMVCLQSGVPYRDQDDRAWRMPVHRWDNSNETGACPGSMSTVTAAPAAPDMSTRIEAHVVAAMPPGAGTVAPDMVCLCPEGGWITYCPVHAAPPPTVPEILATLRKQAETGGH